MSSSAVSDAANDQPEPLMAVAPEPTAPSLFPPHLIVLLLTAVVGVVLGSRASVAWELAQSGELLSESARRGLVVAGVFNVLVGFGLMLALALEALACLTRLLRGGRLALVGARLALACLPLAVLSLGHLLVNRWLVELAAQGRRFLSG